MNDESYSFHVSGMHCHSCVLLTESALKELPYIKEAKSSLKHHSIEVKGDFNGKDPALIVRELSEVLSPHGYSLSLEKQVKDKNWNEFKIAIPIALAFGILFVVLQKIGLVNLLRSDTMTFGTAFVIGLIASVSSCMAVVGGLVLSMSATFAKEDDKVRPQILFHVGRFVSFFILGGAIGVLGSLFGLSSSFSYFLGILIGLVMLLLGINLLDVFRWSKRLQPAMPKFISRHALGISKFNHRLTPLLVGIATFFLPCGFTQSMQIYALGSGNFLQGGLTMLFFALGTLPVLALLSFGFLGLKNKAQLGIFFKAAGLIVILFGLFNIINAMVAFGAIPPILTFLN